MPITYCIWFGIDTVHGFQSRDNIIVEHYQNILKHEYMTLYVLHSLFMQFGQSVNIEYSNIY